jgi:hypothetical protein
MKNSLSAEITGSCLDITTSIYCKDTKTTKLQKYLITTRNFQGIKIEKEVKDFHCKKHLVHIFCLNESFSLDLLNDFYDVTIADKEKFLKKIGYFICIYEKEFAKINI